MYFGSMGICFRILFAINFAVLSLACDSLSDHAYDVITLLNVSVKSEGTNDPGKTPSTNGLAYISVNGKNYAPQKKGWNIAVFDALSGRFLTSAAFDCVDSQGKCNDSGTFLKGLPQDTIVLIAIQESAMGSGRTLPTSELQEVGVQNVASITAHSSLAAIGYKGSKSVDWKSAQIEANGTGPAEVSALISINCSYVPQASTTCSPFNVASQKYGGSCMNQSSSGGAAHDCKNAIDGSSTAGWQSSSNGFLHSFIQIGFHTMFTISKLRIQQNVTTGRQIQEILLEFSDCSHKEITLTANNSNFEEFSFLSRRANWIKITVKKVYNGSSGGVGIKEIEIYNELCKQKTICDAVRLQNNTNSTRYRLHETKFPFMVDAKDAVSVLLTSESRITSSRYEVIIGSTKSKLRRIKGGSSEDLLVKNITEPLKENEMRSFWIEVETDRVVFGSGEKIYLFWRDADPINVKYAFFSTNTSTAIFHVCGRIDQCYKDATHYWPLDKSTVFVQDLNKEGIGKIHGPLLMQRASAKLDFKPLTLSLAGSPSWVDLGDFTESCMSSLLKCPEGISVSFKASISGSGTGYLLSTGGVTLFYVNETMYFTLQDKYKIWEVKGSYKKYTWQTFAISWSQVNGLTAVIVDDADSNVLRNASGKTVTPSAVSHASVTIGRPNTENTKYAHGDIRDVAVWEVEINVERMKTLHVCNDPDTCATGWEYFDGSCYKVTTQSLTASAARTACVNDNADLVKITSEEENAFVRTLAAGEAWIGLETPQGGSEFYWKDGVKISYDKWKGGSPTPTSGVCAVMEASGHWRNDTCSNTAPKYACEKVDYHYLGCYEDSGSSPAFVYNPGGYKPGSMIPGLCMHACGTWYFKYAALKRSNLCLCSNSTSPAVERASDLCSAPCLGSGNLKCGGESHISVYKSVEVRPLRLTMSLEASVHTLSAFNITFSPSLPPNQTVESYTINLGDGTTLYTTQSPATFAIFHPGIYNVQGTAIVKHDKTGYRSAVESSAMATAVSNLTDPEIFCPSCAPINATIGCSVKFRYGSDVNVSIQFGDGKAPVSSSLPDAAVLSVGIPVGEAGSPITSDGLYLMAGMEVTTKGDLVALEMDVEMGGHLGIKVYRPRCNDSERYCRALKTCMSNHTLCTESATKICDNDKTFSFSEGQCLQYAAQNLSCDQNKTLDFGNFDYELVHGYTVYVTSGLKRILIDDESQRFQLEPGDVLSVHFPASGPAAALKTISAGSSLLYSSSIVNRTGDKFLRGNRLPEDNPTQVRFLPAIALVQAAESESRLENVYETVGHNTVSLSVGNSIARVSYTKSICLQETITGLQLNLSEALPFAETVNLTGSIAQGTNVTFIWDFGNKNNATTLAPWVTHAFDRTGDTTVNLLAGNRIGVLSLWCQVVIQERIANLKFKNGSFDAIENGTTARIGWMLFNGSHVDFNITITYPDGNMEARNLTDAKVPAASFFGLYKKNLTLIGWYTITITATNKVNSEAITGNLSVQYVIHGVIIDHPRILKTNQTFNFTISPHHGDEMARYTLETMDGNTTLTTNKVIPYVYSKAGRYNVVLIASNDVSSVIVNCTEIVVQDVIEGLKYTSFNHTVAVHAEAQINWRITQGSELYISIDYGDEITKIVNRSLSVGDIFVAISKHNYTAPGEYRVSINASNLVDSKMINTTVYVETPGQGPGLAIRRGTTAKAEGGPCTGILYIATNDSVTVTATVLNGTNINVTLDFGDDSIDRNKYFHRDFPDEGWTTNHSFSVPGEYNITITFFNRNPQNVSHKCRVIVQDPVDVVMVKSNSPRSSSDSSVTLEVSFPGYQPSGPLSYQWRHGDNTSNQTNNRMIIHTYPDKCGVYIATVNVSNQISYGIGIEEVIIQDPVESLTFITNYTEYVNDCSDFSLQDGKYPLDYKVFFNASVAKGTNVTFTWSFDNGITCTNQSCLHKFAAIGEKKKKVRITAKNDVSNLSRDFSIELLKSILGVQLTNDGPTVQNRAVNFTFQVDQVGDDSCYDINLEDPETNLHLYYKSDSLQPGASCSRSESKDIKSDSLQEEKFSHTYKTPKQYDVTLTAKNLVSCVMLNNEKTKVVVSKGECKLPEITAPGIGLDIQNRTVFKRSERINIKTVNTVECFEPQTEFRWEIYKLCDSDQPVRLTTDEIPDLKVINTRRSELVFPPRFFEYCRTLELRFMINMTKAEGFYSEKKMYIEIAKSPLVAIIDGGSERTVGSNDLVDISAARSYDPDNTTADGPMDSDCEFAWFCKNVNDRNYTLPTNLTNQPSIPTPPPETNSTGNISDTAKYLGGCFGYGPGRLSFTSEKITLNTTRMLPNSTYIIRFVLTKKHRKAVYADQRITIVPGDPPTLSFDCIFNCGPKLNPSEKFTLKGKGKSKGNQKIDYKWEIKRCSKKDGSDCNDVPEKELEEALRSPLKSDVLVIGADYFKGDWSYKVILSGEVTGGTPGSSTYSVKVNTPPKGGKCKVTPKEGKSLDTKFTLSCGEFRDEDMPLKYEFFYSSKKDGQKIILGSSWNNILEGNVLPSGLEEYDYQLFFYVKVEDKLGASKEFNFTNTAKVKKETFTVAQLGEKAKNLDKITASGNVNEAATLVTSIAQVLNEEKSEEKSEEDIKEKQELREKLVSAVVDNADVTKDTSLADVAQISSTLSAATAVPNENSEETTKKVASFIENAGDAIQKQASGEDVSSAKIQAASEAVFSTAENVILSTDSSQGKKQSSSETSKPKEEAQKITRKALNTVNKLTTAVLTTKIAGEKETTMKTKTLAVGVSIENAIGKEAIHLTGSTVKFPDNFSNFDKVNTSVNRVSMVSATNLYSGGKRGKLVNNKLVSLSYSDSKGEINVTDPEKEISVMLPRNEKAEPLSVEKGKLYSGKYSVHEFNITHNESAVHIRVGWGVSVDVELYVSKGSKPKPLKGVYDFNTTLQLGRHLSVNTSNSTDPSSHRELFLSNDDLNWTAEGTYFALLRFIENNSLPEKERAKIDSDGTIPYNVSIYTSMCMYYDEKKEDWSREGMKVGLKTNVDSTECLTTHLTTFGCSFFVPPNKINFDQLSEEKLWQSPHALIFVCVILGLYLICLILARRADRSDTLKTGVTPLPDNDSRDTYCYEIHVHTGFVRGAGTSAEVSVVLTGGLGDSEPRVLKDPNRKNFTTGSVNLFLLTLPQSIGNLKHIRIWHNNGGNYPSWNLLRVMIQDLQTDQRWWFVCDDWLAVDESDGKIERILYPASKNELTKFNVLFASEVRKNLTDGHIWFSVVARPPHSTFTRVQRLTCCLCILMTTLIANAMFYEVGKNETPKNAIRIMGFSFSIRQVSIGVMSGMIVFPVNLIIATIFRKAKPKESRYTAKPERDGADDVDIEAAEQTKKAPAKFALPHWFVYIAYVIAFLATCASASFVIMYGMEFGPEKSAQWLSSITISFIQDVLFTQPIKVFIMATLFALLIKDPKKAEQESLADANALVNDEEWLHKNTEDLDPEMQQTLKQLINDKPPDEAKLEIARKLRMKEKQMKSIIREIVWYMIFLLVLLTIAYGNRDLTTSKVTKYMQNTFEKATYNGNITYNKVREIHHYWKWMRETFIPSLMPKVYYNNETYVTGFLADTPTAHLLGVARLRQLRIRKDTCTFKRFFLYFIHECNDFYSTDEEDRGSYLPGWNVEPLIPNQNLSVGPTTTPTTLPQEKGPWEYQTGSQLKTYPYWGYKATYSAGGYVQELPNNEGEALNIIQNLSDTNWLDRYTRAIFSEFAIYNANTNLFCVVTLLFEQLPTGSFTPYPSILTLRLFRYVGGEMYFVLTCEIVYLLFCAVFVVKEIKQFVKKGREHLKNPWSILEILLTLLSLSAVGLYFARLSFRNSSLKTWRGGGTSFVSFHYTAFLDEWLKCIMGIIVFLSFLKMFRLFRFNRRMSMLQQVLKRCFGQLISFMVMFALAFLAFALFACLVFGQSMEGFGTFLKSCASLMDTLLGKFTLKEMSKANRIIGPIFFYTYTVSMVFILINMFLSIINDAFTEVRSDVEKQSNDYEIVDFMIHRFKENIGKTIGHAIHPVYKEPKTDLELNFDKITDNADNAMHFMRNIAFEDMRKTRWFQEENCSEKKKNLIRLLIEVDWDYYEDELCDSIPVFERFLSQRSEEELEAMLQSYREKRMVEDLVFNEINGQNDSSESDSDSDDSNDDDDSSDDAKSSNVENDSETELGWEEERRLSTLSFRVTPQSSIRRPGSASSVKSPGSVSRVKSPPLIITDVEATTLIEQGQYAAENRRASTFVDQAVPENELVAILDDVRREAESRCATDAELDSILYGDDTSTLRRCDSDPETSTADKKKKKRKKKKEEMPLEDTTPKEAWVTVVVTNDQLEEDVEKKKKKKTKKEGEDHGDVESVKPKKKAKTTVVPEEVEETQPKKKKQRKDTADITMEEKGEGETNEGMGGRNKKKNRDEASSNLATDKNCDEMANEDKGKKKKKKKEAVTGTATEENGEEEFNTGEGKKKKKKKKPAADIVAEENGEDEMNEGEERKKTKKKETEADMAKEDNLENETNEDEKKKKKNKSKEAAAEGVEDTKVSVRKKTKKKNREGTEENGEEKTSGDDEKPKKKERKTKDELGEMMPKEGIEPSDTDQAETKKKKKKGKAKKQLASEEDVQRFKSDETDDRKESLC